MKQTKNYKNTRIQANMKIPIRFKNRMTSISIPESSIALFCCIARDTDTDSDACAVSEISSTGKNIQELIIQDTVQKEITELIRDNIHLWDKPNGIGLSKFVQGLIFKSILPQELRDKYDNYEKIFSGTKIPKENIQST